MIELYRAPGGVVGISQASQFGCMLQLIMAKSRHTNRHIQHVLTEHYSAKMHWQGKGTLYRVALQLSSLPYPNGCKLSVRLIGVVSI